MKKLIDKGHLEAKKTREKNDTEFGVTKEDLKNLATKKDIQSVKKDLKELTIAIAKYTVDTQANIQRIEKHIGLPPLH